MNQEALNILCNMKKNYLTKENHAYDVDWIPQFVKNREEAINELIENGLVIRGATGAFVDALILTQEGADYLEKI